MDPMIVLFTDFGLDGPYTGQVKTVLYRTAPGVPVVDLFAEIEPADCNARDAACRSLRRLHARATAFAYLVIQRGELGA